MIGHGKVHGNLDICRQKLEESANFFGFFENGGGHGGAGIKHIAFYKLTNHPRQHITNLIPKRL